MADTSVHFWVVEHSKRQGQFHIETLDSALARNVRMFITDKNADRDYVPLAIVADRKEAREAIKRLKAMKESHSQTSA